jgi:hypothetical protein
MQFLFVYLFVALPILAFIFDRHLQETRMIEDYWDFDEVFPESRLASMITLTKQMNGMIVYVPPRVDDSNP